MTSSSCVLVVVAAAAVAVAVIASADSPTTRSDGRVALVARHAGGAPAVARPRSLRLDATHVVRSIRWSTWGGPTAVGTGTQVVRSSGRAPRRTPTRLTFSARRRCGEQRSYERLTLRLRRPGAKSNRRTLHAFTSCRPRSDTPPATPSRHAANCFQRPTACGYPGPTSTGVAAGTALTPVDRAELPPGVTWDSEQQLLSVTVPGTVITGLELTGVVVVHAARVTISNTRITSPPDGFGVAIPAGSAADDTKLLGVSIGGAPGAGSSAAVNNRGSNTLTIAGSYLHDCYECFQNQAQSGGTTIIRDSYIRTSDPKLGCDADCPHYEAIYASGNPGPMTLVRNTLLNPIDQTAVVYIDQGRHDDLTITDNLLAGGGYSIYAGAQSRRQVITRNRFSNAFQRSGLDTHTSGRWPVPSVCTARRSSGCFGTLTSAPQRSGLTWSGNYWDDTLRPVGY